MEIQEFEREINRLGERLPVSASKINLLTKYALNNIKVLLPNQSHEQFIRSVVKSCFTCPPNVKLPTVYVIDSICRQSQKLAIDVYRQGFEREFPQMFKELAKCPDGDKVHAIDIGKDKEVDKPLDGWKFIFKRDFESSL
jgi:hypothetical protein